MRAFAHPTPSAVEEFRCAVEHAEVEPLRRKGLDGAFLAMTREHADAVVQMPSPMLYSEHKRIVKLAAKSRLPAIYGAREFVEDGGLMSYGASQPSLFRNAATYVDKILKGANPADLPVEEPTKLELVFNLKTAKDLGLAIPRELLSLADEVIE